MVDKKKNENEEPHIETKLTGTKDEAEASTTAPVNPAGAVRRENESDASRDGDGQRKRAEEGL